MQTVVRRIELLVPTPSAELAAVGAASLPPGVAHAAHALAAPHVIASPVEPRRDPTPVQPGTTTLSHAASQQRVPGKAPSRRSLVVGLAGLVLAGAGGAWLWARQASPASADGPLNAPPPSTILVRASAMFPDKPRTGGVELVVHAPSEARYAAAKVTPIAEAGEPAAVVVVVQGTARFLGNESYVSGDDARPGAWRATAAALDAVGRTAWPAAMGALVSYGSKIRVLAPLGPLHDLRGDRLGAQRDFADERVPDLAAGVREARSLVSGGAARGRRYLILIGTGATAESSPDELVGLVAQLREAGIEAHAILLGEDDLAAGRALAGDRAHTVASQDELATAVSQVMARVGSEYFLEVPIQPLDKPTPATLRSNGAEVGQLVIPPHPDATLIVPP
jgi:hypothetical protein